VRRCARRSRSASPTMFPTSRWPGCVSWPMYGPRSRGSDSTAITDWKWGGPESGAKKRWDTPGDETWLDRGLTFPVRSASVRFGRTRALHHDIAPDDRFLAAETALLRPPTSGRPEF